MKFLSFKKVLDGQSDIHITITYVLTFLQDIIRIQKDCCETQKNLEIKVYIDAF